MNRMISPADDARALAEEGQAVRDFIKSNQSDTLLRLFDFLLQQSLEGRRPKEIEVAEEVFRSSAEPATAQGSRVRVGIHRLRRKLELYYGDRTGPRIVIPRGEYGLLLELPGERDVDETTAPLEPRQSGNRKSSVWILATALLLVNVALACLYFSDEIGLGENALGSTLWRGFDDTKGTKIVAGDYFMFLSKSVDTGVDEPTQDLSIADLGQFYDRVSKDPSSSYYIMDGDPRPVAMMVGDASTVSVDILESIGNLWPLIKKFRPSPATSSDLNAAMMKSSNIIYVGTLDALSPLIGAPLFEVSRFRCADTCYELVDKKTGRHFLSGSPYVLADQIVPRHDYGYIASFPGPSGKRILVISGTSDAGVRQMVNLAMDPKRLRQLGQRIHGAFGSFEALYQVRTMFSENYQSSFLVAHPIDMKGVWDQTKPLNWSPAPR